MCINPITIKNRAKYRTYGAFEYLSVPCRNCPECADMISNDYFLRAYSIYKNLDPCKWSVFFVTLTFNDANCPMHHFYTNNIDGTIEHLGLFPCFDHSLLRRFFKSLRQYYRRKLTVVERARNPLTGRWKKVNKKIPDWKNLPHILASCEYGDKRHRPHYHLIMFIPQLIGWKDFQKLLEHFWPYGFNKSIKMRLLDGQLGERSDANCFKYVTKYAMKGSDGYKPIYFARNVFSDIPRCDYMPRVFTTNNFGSLLCEMINDEMIKRGTIALNVEGKFRRFFIPQYVIRKRLYQTHFIQSPVNVLERKDATIFEQEYYDTKTKSVQVTERSADGDLISAHRALYQMKTDYFHAQQAWIGAGKEFKKYLIENGFAFTPEDISEAVSMSPSAYAEYGLSHLYYNECWSSQRFKKIEYFPGGLPNYLKSLPFPPDDVTLSKWASLVIDSPTFFHKPLKLYPYLDNVPFVICLSLVESYKRWQCHCREMSYYGRKKRELAFYQSQGITKSE